MLTVSSGELSIGDLENGRTRRHKETWGSEVTSSALRVVTNASPGAVQEMRTRKNSEKLSMTRVRQGAVNVEIVPALLGCANDHDTRLEIARLCVRCRNLPSSLLSRRVKMDLRSKKLPKTMVADLEAFRTCLSQCANVSDVLCGTAWP